MEQAFADLVQSGHIRRPNVVMTCMRILIIGGSGVAGRPTAAKLIRRGHSVAILSRRGSGGPPGAQAFAGDITTGAGLDRALAGVDCVIDCANRTTTSRKAAVAYVTDTTQRLGRLGRAAGVGHHIVLSIVSLEAVSAGRQGGAAPTFPGAIAVVYRGCSDFTLLVVTGPGRGRLVEVNAEGFFAPRRDGTRVAVPTAATKRRRRKPLPRSRQPVAAPSPSAPNSAYPTPTPCGRPSKPRRTGWTSW